MAGATEGCSPGDAVRISKFSRGGNVMFLHNISNRFRIYHWRHCVGLIVAKVSIVYVMIAVVILIGIAILTGVMRTRNRD